VRIVVGYAAGGVTDIRDIVLGTDLVRHAGLSHFRPSATLAMPALAQISYFSSPDAASKHKPLLDGIRSSDQTD
jgi:hypothetical protein